MPQTDRAVLVRRRGFYTGRSHYECHSDGRVTHWKNGVLDKTYLNWAETRIGKTYNAVELLDDRIDRTRFRVALLESWAVERPDALTAKKMNFSMPLTQLRRMVDWSLARVG